MYTCASSRARSQADAFAAIDDLHQGSRRGHPADQQQVRASGRGRPGSPVWAPVSAASEISLSVDALGGPALTTAWIVPQCRSSGYEPCRQPLEATEICAITAATCAPVPTGCSLQSVIWLLAKISCGSLAQGGVQADRRLAARRCPAHWSALRRVARQPVVTLVPCEGCAQPPMVVV